MINGHIQRVVHNLCAIYEKSREKNQNGLFGLVESQDFSIANDVELNESRTTLRESPFHCQNLESAQ